MGVDAGFDMVLRLSESAEDKKSWQSFIKIIKEYYENDDLVEIKPNYIVFKAGEHPRLSFEGHRLLRFSPKITNSHTKEVWDYFRIVTAAAKLYFGSRVHKWDEGGDSWGFYDWRDVHDTIISYEQVGMLYSHLAQVNLSTHFSLGNRATQVYLSETILI